MIETAEFLVTIRPVVSGDTVFRRRLFTESRVELTALPAATRTQMLDLQWQAQARQYDNDYPHARREIIELNGEAVGHMVIDGSGAQIRLVDIAIAVDHRGKGVARRVLTDLVAAAEADARDVDLQVWSGNLAARRLYVRHGFHYLAEDRGGYLPMRRTSTHQSEARR